MTIGSGFMIDAMRRARQFEREMSRSRERPRVRLHGPPAPDEETFDCAWVCTGCGLFRDPPTSQADADAPCGHCQARAWVDLRSFRNAQLLREVEERLRATGPPQIRRRVRTAAGVLGVAVAGATAVAFTAALGGVALLPIAVVAAATGGAGATVVDQLLGRSLSRWLLTREPVGPARWRCAMPKPDLASTIVERRSGIARAVADTIDAPVSGRACLAYEVGVIFDADGDAYPPVWILREERNTEMLVDDVVIGRDQAALELPLLPVGEAADARPPETLSRFLRTRGLFAADGQFEFFESILEPQAPVELVRHAEPAGAPWVVTPA